MVGKAMLSITSIRWNAAALMRHRICNGRPSQKRRSRIAQNAIAAENSRSSHYMAVYFRQGIGFGPFRLNLSKSGIGAQFGARGAMISARPRRPYISDGVNGCYYRQQLA